jgi:hypothetical protein
MSEVVAKGAVIAHGAYGSVMALDCVRHWYGGADDDGEGRYREVLEFPDPPPGRPRFVLHYYSTRNGHVVYAMPSLEVALGSWPRREADGTFRRVGAHVPEVGAPWFFSKEG